jgi:hypothetical protein
MASATYTVHQPARIFGEAVEFPLWAMPDATHAVRACLPRDSNTLILTDMPDRIASAAHVHNWFAYANQGSVVTAQQIDHVFAVAARRHVTSVVTQFVSRGPIAAHGFVQVRRFPFNRDIGLSSEYAGTTTVWAKQGAVGAVDCHGAGQAPDLVSK